MNFGVPVLALRRRTHLAAQFERHQLHAIADTEHRLRQFKDAFVHPRRVLVINGRRPARQDNADRFVSKYLFQLGVTRKDDGKNVQFADAARN